MNSMRDPLNLDHHPHHPFTGTKLASSMASGLQPLVRAVDSGKHRMDAHAVSDSSSPETVGKKKRRQANGRQESYLQHSLTYANEGLIGGSYANDTRKRPLHVLF